MDYGQAQAQFKASISDDMKQAPVESGLVRIAEEISHATSRIHSMASRMTELGTAIHGPRPEPVSGGAGQQATAVDSLSSRVNSLLISLDHLESSYTSVVR